ncbi:MAG: GNAT family N-acetyltransferase [Lachnospiraceae bacterium]
MKELLIRTEREEDYRAVEQMTRDAFWNIYIPGCVEHYLVHSMRGHADFISELALVAEVKGQIVANIMYTKAKLIDEQQVEKEILTFGPLCVHPAYQRQGIGKQLMAYSFDKALEMGLDVVVIFGNPGNYVSSGFKSCKKYNVCMEDDVFPSAMLVRELRPDCLDGRRWYYHDSPVFAVDEAEALKYDAQFEEKEKKYQHSQEEFYIHSHSVIR